jgi:hypothetical protein
VNSKREHQHIKNEKVVPATPVNTLRDRIKQRLQSNAGVRTPQGPGSVIKQQQEEQLQKVYKEVRLLHDLWIQSSCFCPDLEPIIKAITDCNTIFC